MKYIFLLLALLVACSNSNAQKFKKADTGQKDRQVFTCVDDLPEAPYDLQKYLAAHLRYPKNVEAYEGHVIVKFTVNEDGRISDCEVIKGHLKEYDAEALRVVSGMPRWNPVMRDGKYIKVPFWLPVSFKTGK